MARTSAQAAALKKAQAASAAKRRKGTVVPKSQRVNGAAAAGRHAALKNHKASEKRERRQEGSGTLETRRAGRASDRAKLKKDPTAHTLRKVNPSMYGTRAERAGLHSARMKEIAKQAPTAWDGHYPKLVKAIAAKNKKNKARRKAK